MLWLIKQVCIALISFSISLTTKCVPLKNESCITEITPIDLNPIELNDYPFMISLYKCFGSHNAINALSTIMCFPSDTKDVNVKVSALIKSNLMLYKA